MIKLDKQRFNSSLQKLKELENIEVTENLNVIIHGHEKIFNNCEFGNCEFQNSTSILSFNNCSFKNIQIILGISSERITLNNCNAEDVEIVGRNDQLVSYIDVIGSETKIKNLKTKGGFRCNKINLDGTTKLSRVTLQVNCEKTYIHNIQGIEYFVMSGEVRKLIEFKNCIDFGSLQVQDIKADRIEFSDSNNLNVSFDSTNTKYINFNRCISTCIETNYLTSEHLGLNSGSFEKISFYHDCNFNFSAGSVTEELTIKHFTFYGSNPKRDRIFKIEYAKIKELVLDGLQNDGIIIFQNCEISDLLNSYRSNLGKFQFTNIVLNESCRIDILDSNITDVYFNSFKWNRRYKLSEVFDPYIRTRYSKPTIFFQSLRESYRQLKANYTKNGNKIEALEFQRGELEIHLKILGENPMSLRNVGNYLIVATNKWFSDFGQNIWKPIFFSFRFSLINF